jgi:hypothetical protein
MTERQMRAAINVQAELMQCSAYFALVGVCLDRSGASGTEHTAASANMRELGLRVGLGIAMTNDALQSQFRLYIDDMMRLTAGQPCQNISSLRARHETRCLRYARDPEGAMGEHLR